MTGVDGDDGAGSTGPGERRDDEFAVFRTDAGDLVVYDVTPGRDTRASGAWIRIHPDDCVELVDAE
jgi:hypothetical protein